MRLCKYGCGKEAKYQNKSGDWICEKSSNSCSILKEKRSESLRKNHKEQREKGIPHCHQGKKGKMIGWEKFSSEEINLLCQKSRDAFKQSGRKRKGWKMSDESKEKISRSRKNVLSSNKGHCKYYSLYCPFEQQRVILQGTWELQVALYLNENEILWTKNYSQHNFNYIIPGETNKRTYYPDFYLPEFDFYLEVKSEYRPYKSRSIFYSEKIDLVKWYNPEAKIILIMNDSIKNDIILQEKVDFSFYLNNPEDREVYRKRKIEDQKRKLQKAEEAKNRKEEKREKLLKKQEILNAEKILKGKESLNGEKQKRRKSKRNEEFYFQCKEKLSKFIEITDFSFFKKHGWVERLSKELNVSHTHIPRLLKMHFPELLEKAYKRKSYGSMSKLAAERD